MGVYLVTVDDDSVRAGKHDDELGAWVIVSNRHSGIVNARDTCHHRKAEAKPTFPATTTVVDSFEPIEDALSISLRNAESVIGNREHNM